MALTGHGDVQFRLIHEFQPFNCVRSDLHAVAAAWQTVQQLLAHSDALTKVD
jgi:hypothetical protein